MAVWVVRGGRYGEREEEALENGMLAIGWSQIGNLTDVKARDEVELLLRRALPDESPYRIGNYTGQIWSFRGEIKEGDLIVLPRKGQPFIAIGEITGEYIFRDVPEFSHNRPVKWLEKAFSRGDLPGELKNPLNGAMTVFQPRVDNAEQKLRSIVEHGSPLSEQPIQDSVPEQETRLDVSEVGIGQIRDYVGRKFRDHEFTRLVAEVLKCQGYSVEVAPPGRDGGVDVVAGSGPLGFDPPRICVQVKSGTQVVDVHVLRQLAGVIKNFGADYGLLVSWGGFNSAALREAREGSYFNMRLWDSQKFLELLFENYDKLPSAMRSELPLKQIWVLDDPSES